MKEIYQYFVEGENEKRLIEVLKTDLRLIKPGKIQVVNVVEERLTDLKLRVLSSDTILIFVFDTDTNNVEILNENIEKAKKASNVKMVRCITQVRNLEDELVRCTNVRKIEELLDSKGRADFKRDFNKEKNLKQKLQNHSFEISKLWNQKPQKPFDKIVNEAEWAKY